MYKTNILLGLVGCGVFQAGAILSATRGHTLSASLLALFAVIYIWRTALLIRRARHQSRPA